MFPVSDINNQAFVIFSSSEPEETVRTVLAQAEIPFKVVEGKYKGEVEKSYVVNFRDNVTDLGILDDQESVLALGPIDATGLRPAVLHLRKDNEILAIGHFTPVSKEEAEEQDNYTYDPTQDQYYVAK